MADENKKIGSTILIDGEEYEVMAKTAEKVANNLTITAGTTNIAYNGEAAKTINIKGSGATNVTADSNGNITISSVDSGITSVETTGSGNAVTTATYDTATKKLTLGKNGTYSDAAFKNIAVSGQSTVVADSAADTLTLVAGNNITLTTNATNDSITIAATSTGGSGSDGGAAASAETIKVVTSSGPKYATITISTDEPSAGNVGDIWFKY